MEQIFQQRVLEKYISDQDESIVKQRWEKFQKFQLKAIANKEDKTSFLYKEEEYQAGFLSDVFENCLGYKLNIHSSNNDFNLRREVKNESDSKKADGAIIVDSNVVGVIELKAQDTKHIYMKPSKGKLSPIDQAFGYLTAQDSRYAKYVIVSNFDELRFYIKDKLNYERFKLISLDFYGFKKLHTILSHESISSDLPLKIKQESVAHEEDITDKLYKDYTKFRIALFENIKKNNPTIDEVKLLSMTQKLIDRIVFILFAEDTGILPINSIYTIIEEHKKSNDGWSEPKSLYDFYKIYFRAIDKGNEKLDITTYNGGLFAEDQLLDSLIIDDNVLDEQAKKLSKYRFGSEISVNILGHIFEKSITALEEITAQIQNIDYDKKKSQQKIDGAFYTPEYITRYIVDNTLGKQCADKKAELNLDTFEEPKNAKRLTKKEKSYLDAVYQYREWLLNLKILDPACGSGAFLNQTLNFLLAEHKFVDDVRRLYENEGLGLYDTKATILKNNLYGVDINEGAVDIAKLSLWLSTAEKGEPLTTLAEKIKVGNSLIPDENVIDNAFAWEEEFPEVFEQGGFDVIIGNPPYVKEAINKDAFNGLHNHLCYQGKMDLWYFFGALALELIKEEEGVIGYIAPNNWITNDGASNFRNIILNQGRLISFVDFGDFKVFDTAGIQTMIYIMKKSDNNQNYSFEYSRVLDKKIKHGDAQLFLEKFFDPRFEYFKTAIEKDIQIDKPINFINTELNIIINKILSKKNFSLNSSEIASGIDVLQDFVNKKHKEVLEGTEIGDGIFNLSENEFISLNLSQKEKSIIKPFYTTKELGRYFGNKINKYWIIYTNSEFKNKENIEPYPNIKAHLDKFKSIFTSVNKPYGLHRSRNEKYFQGEKILSLRKCSVRPRFTYVNFDTYVNRTFMVIQTERINKMYLTGLLNSTLLAFWLKYKGKMQGNNYQIDKNPLLNLPIIKPNKEIQNNVAELVSQIINSMQKQIDYSNLLQMTRLENNFDREIKLEKELSEIQPLIDSLDRQIDNIIFKLYGLNPEEVNTIIEKMN